MSCSHVHSVACLHLQVRVSALRTLGHLAHRAAGAQAAAEGHSLVEGAAGDEVRALLFGCVVESVQAVRREARRVLEFVGVAPKELDELQSRQDRGTKGRRVSTDAPSAALEKHARRMFPLLFVLAAFLVFVPAIGSAAAPSRHPQAEASARP